MRQRRTERGQDPGWLYSLLPAAFFFLGVATGIFYAGQVSEQLNTELTEYLTRYLSLSQQEFTLSLLCSSAWAYLRVPALVLLSSLTPLGLVLLPLSAVAVGFFPAYAVGCLTASFGGAGVWLALGLFGLRSLATIPCYFLLAAHAWSASAGMLRVSFGRGHPFSPVHDQRWWLRFAGVCLFLCGALCVELRWGPLLTQNVLSRVFKERS